MQVKINNNKVGNIITDGIFYHSYDPLKSINKLKVKDSNNNIQLLESSYDSEVEIITKDFLSDKKTSKNSQFVQLRTIQILKNNTDKNEIANKMLLFYRAAAEEKLTYIGTLNLQRDFSLNSAQDLINTIENGKTLLDLNSSLQDFNGVLYNRYTNLLGNEQDISLEISNEVCEGLTENYDKKNIIFDVEGNNYKIEATNRIICSNGKSKELSFNNDNEAYPIINNIQFKIKKESTGNIGTVEITNKKFLSFTDVKSPDGNDTWSYLFIPYTSPNSEQIELFFCCFLKSTKLTKKVDNFEHSIVFNNNKENDYKNYDLYNYNNYTPSFFTVSKSEKALSLTKNTDNYFQDSAVINGGELSWDIHQNNMTTNINEIYISLDGANFYALNNLEFYNKDNELVSTSLPRQVNLHAWLNIFNNTENFKVKEKNKLAYLTPISDLKEDNYEFFSINTKNSLIKEKSITVESTQNFELLFNYNLLTDKDFYFVKEDLKYYIKENNNKIAEVVFGNDNEKTINFEDKEGHYYKFKIKKEELTQDNLNYSKYTISNPEKSEELICSDTTGDILFASKNIVTCAVTNVPKNYFNQGYSICFAIKKDLGSTVLAKSKNFKITNKITNEQKAFQEFNFSKDKDYVEYVKSINTPHQGNYYFTYDYSNNSAPEIIINKYTLTNLRSLSGKGKDLNSFYSFDNNEDTTLGAELNGGKSFLGYGGYINAKLPTPNTYWKSLDDYTYEESKYINVNNNCYRVEEDGFVDILSGVKYGTRTVLENEETTKKIVVLPEESKQSSLSFYYGETTATKGYIITTSLDDFSDKHSDAIIKPYNNKYYVIYSIDKDKINNAVYLGNVDKDAAFLYACQILDIGKEYYITTEQATGYEILKVSDNESINLTTLETSIHITDVNYDKVEEHQGMAEFPALIDNKFVKELDFKNNSNEYSQIIIPPAIQDYYISADSFSSNRNEEEDELYNLKKIRSYNIYSSFSNNSFEAKQLTNYNSLGNIYIGDEAFRDSKLKDLHNLYNNINKLYLGKNVFYNSRLESINLDKVNTATNNIGKLFTNTLNLQKVNKTDCNFENGLLMNGTNIKLVTLKGYQELENNNNTEKVLDSILKLSEIVPESTERCTYDSYSFSPISSIIKTLVLDNIKNEKDKIPKYYIADNAFDFGLDSKISTVQLLNRELCNYIQSSSEKNTITNRFYSTISPINNNGVGCNVYVNMVDGNQITDINNKPFFENNSNLQKIIIYQNLVFTGETSEGTTSEGTEGARELEPIYWSDPTLVSINTNTTNDQLYLSNSIVPFRHSNYELTFINNCDTSSLENLNPLSSIIFFNNNFNTIDIGKNYISNDMVSPSETSTISETSTTSETPNFYYFDNYLKYNTDIFYIEDPNIDNYLTTSNGNVIKFNNQTKDKVITKNLNLLTPISNNSFNNLTKLSIGVGQFNVKVETVESEENTKSNEKRDFSNLTLVFSKAPIESLQINGGTLSCNSAGDLPNYPYFSSLKYLYLNIDNYNEPNSTSCGLFKKCNKLQKVYIKYHKPNSGPTFIHEFFTTEQDTIGVFFHKIGTKSLEVIFQVNNVNDADDLEKELADKTTGSMEKLEKVFNLGSAIKIYNSEDNTIKQVGVISEQFEIDLSTPYFYLMEEFTYTELEANSDWFKYGDKTTEVTS